MSGLRVTGNKNDGIVVLKVEHDKEYDLMQIAERFEVPYFEPKNPWQAMQYLAMIEGVAHAVGKKAIERYEKLRHWRYYSARSFYLDKSDVQYDLDDFSSSSQRDFDAVEHGSLLTKKGMVGYVIKMWFIVPKIQVEVIKDDPTDPDTVDGFVNEHNMFKDVDLGGKKTRKGNRKLNARRIATGGEPIRKRS